MLSTAWSELLRRPIFDISTLRSGHGTCTCLHDWGSEISSSVGGIPTEISSEEIPDLILVSACQYWVQQSLSPQSIVHMLMVAIVLGQFFFHPFHMNQWVLRSSLILPTTNSALTQTIGSCSLVKATPNNPCQATSCPDSHACQYAWCTGPVCPTSYSILLHVRGH